MSLALTGCSSKQQAVLIEWLMRTTPLEPRAREPEHNLLV
ncbi:MAG: hypothetical protein RLY84_560 [Actinomycetota bacterium]|jgi:hypothetical protein